MRHRLFIMSLAGLLLFSCVPMRVVGGESAYTDGQAAQLKASDVKTLKELKAPIAVPTYVPQGFTLTSVTAQSESSDGFVSVDYSLEYRNEKGDAFNIASANEGVGDALFVSSLTGDNPFFEGVIAVGGREPEVGDADNREVGSQWIECKPAFVPRGAVSKKQLYKLQGEGLSQEEALKVMLSLRYLK